MILAPRACQTDPERRLTTVDSRTRARGANGAAHPELDSDSMGLDFGLEAAGHFDTMASLSLPRGLGNPEADLTGP